ncbi:fumarate hydratase C-terminal domain-containing protein [Pigmentiphaga litoralis]|uniref:Fumarate hydratase subunit beta n=1 Tax=Pigmentiphaga litoralis TaxID=516702 RepID=A0A7Y9IRP7_9BURK|nr:fumarate hydratase C-terminal domain-containing protein [Pigmentiphaga litoralis]NYE25278.1 fumarate hydratase subunit beta [Pigmentiphaga litoralis]NYE81109.1 fumarate hydratase subunit beta [Pigmentiphaga litoralis]
MTSTVSPTTRRMTFPLSLEDARSLNAGDLLLIDGEIVVTAGLPTHQRLLEALKGTEPLPLELHEGCLFHIGSYSEEAPDGSFIVRYINPTTSTRFNPYMPTLIRELGLHAVGGKGGLDAASVAAMKETGCVYLSFLGGGCTLLSEAVKEVLEVGWRDMLTHYRVVRLKVEALGPVTVAIDAHGNSCYADVMDSVSNRLPDILESLAQERRQAADREAARLASLSVDPGK